MGDTAEWHVQDPRFIPDPTEKQTNKTKNIPQLNKVQSLLLTVY